MIRRITPRQALDRLETLCARSEQCEYDLMTKMSRWGISADMADKILSRLRDARYVDDSRFAHAYVREKYLFQRWGRQKIRLGLRAKRIDSDTVNDAIEEEIDEETYRKNALHLLRAKARTLDDPQSYDGCTRLLRFGAGRGYEFDLIIKLLKSPELWEEEE